MASATEVSSYRVMISHQVLKLERKEQCAPRSCLVCVLIHNFSTFRFKPPVTTSSMLITKHLLKQAFRYRWYTMQTLLTVCAISAVLNRQCFYASAQTLLVTRDATSPEPTPPPSPSLKDSPSCLVVGDVLGTCNSNTPGFTSMDPATQAQGLCYSNTVWQWMSLIRPLNHVQIMPALRFRRPIQLCQSGRFLPQRGEC
jgi:hypothetical protein